MKTALSLVLVVASLSLAGCGKTENTAASAPAAADTPAPAPAAPSTPAPAAVRVIEVSGNDQMKFSVTRIEAKAGEQLKIVFTNAGTLPKMAMGHNLIVLKKGTDAQAYCNAALRAAATDYIPAELSAQVLAATKLLGPKEKDEITFTVPSEAGEYPYVCSFPAHYVAGMRGVLVVQ
jgi:azurin